MQKSQQIQDLKLNSKQNPRSGAKIQDFMQNRSKIQDLMLKSKQNPRSGAEVEATSKI